MILNLIFIEGSSQLFLLSVCTKLNFNRETVYENILVYICLIKNIRGFTLYLNYGMSVKN